jgi:hypothetical protein
MKGEKPDRTDMRGEPYPGREKTDNTEVTTEIKEEKNV